MISKACLYSVNFKFQTHDTPAHSFSSSDILLFSRVITPTKSQTKMTRDRRISSHQMKRRETKGERTRDLKDTNKSLMVLSLSFFSFSVTNSPTAHGSLLPKSWLVMLFNFFISLLTNHDFGFTARCREITNDIFCFQIPSHKQSVASSQEDRDCLWWKGIWKKIIFALQKIFELWPTAVRDSNPFVLECKY